MAPFIVRFRPILPALYLFTRPSISSYRRDWCDFSLMSPFPSQYLAFLGLLPLAASLVHSCSHLTDAAMVDYYSHMCSNRLIYLPLDSMPINGQYVLTPVFNHMLPPGVPTPMLLVRLAVTGAGRLPAPNIRSQLSNQLCIPPGTMAGWRFDGGPPAHLPFPVSVDTSHLRPVARHSAPQPSSTTCSSSTWPSTVWTPSSTWGPVPLPSSLSAVTTCYAQVDVYSGLPRYTIADSSSFVLRPSSRPRPSTSRPSTGVTTSTFTRPSSTSDYFPTPLATSTSSMSGSASLPSLPDAYDPMFDVTHWPLDPTPFLPPTRVSPFPASGYSPPPAATTSTPSQMPPPSSQMSQPSQMTFSPARRVTSFFRPVVPSQRPGSRSPRPSSTVTSTSLVTPGVRQHPYLARTLGSSYPSLHDATRFSSSLSGVSGLSFATPVTTSPPTTSS